MVTPKQRQLLAISANKNKSPSLIDSSNSKTEVNLPGEDIWVIVKKQRVTILVPPLPVAKQPTTTNPGPSQLQAMPRKTVDSRSQFAVYTRPRMHSADKREKSMSFAPKKDIQIARKTPSAQPSTLSKVPKLNFMMGSESADRVDSFKSHNKLGACNASKAIKRPKLLHRPVSFFDGGVLLNQRMRALNLERKLQRAGGLSRWLASLGLGQFVRIFQRKSINKFQLVNLTMKKLKDMGADAVGPRRKLMHAIDCLCYPYCFEAF